jgi:hypothetical protein
MAPIDEEILTMLEILTVQVIAAILGTLSVGTADWLYHRGRIRQTSHSLWISSSSTAICLPIITWTANVFLGAGIVSWVLVGTLGVMMFFWLYRNLLKVPPVQRIRPGPIPLHSSGRPVPPSSDINHR